MVGVAIPGVIELVSFLKLGTHQTHRGTDLLAAQKGIAADGYRLSGSGETLRVTSTNRSYCEKFHRYNGPRYPQEDAF